nr:ras gtpase activating protein [Hymenolepis microstoma]
MPLLPTSVAKKRAKSWKGEDLEKRRMLSQQSTLDEKPEVALQPTEASSTKLSNAVSQPLVYLSSSSKANWPTVEKLFRSESIVHQVDGSIPPPLDPEFVKRRATTLAIDMSSEPQSKAANRRRLFSIFSKQCNSTREGVNLRNKQDCPSVDNFSNESAASSSVVQSLVDSLGRHKSDLKFSVSALHDSIVHRGAKNCFQVSTFFPPSKPLLRSANTHGQDPRQERVSSLSRRWAQDRFRSMASMDDDDDDGDDFDSEDFVEPSTVCLRRPAATDRHRFNRRKLAESQEPHSVHRIYSCRSPEERNYWLNKFQCVTNPNLCSEKRIENSLHLCIQEIKGVPIGNDYFCEIYLDDALYAQTATKTVTETLSWSEDFGFTHVPSFNEIQVLLWMFAPTMVVEKVKNRRASLPRSGVVSTGRSELLSTYRISIPNHSDSVISMESEVSSSAENTSALDDVRSRKRRRPMGMSGKKASANLLLIAKFIIPASDITGMVDNESWYTSSLDASLKRRSFAEYSSTSLSLSTFDGVLARPSSLKRNSQVGPRLSRKTLTKLTITPPRLRLSARLLRLTVLPLCGYSSLLRALSNPAACTMLLLRRLEPFLSVKSKAAVAKSLLATLHLRGEVPAFLAAMVLSEVQEQDNPNMVLRSNSLATKAIELYLKQVGGPYLKSALGEFVTSVLTQTASPVIANDSTETSPPFRGKEKRAPRGRMRSSTTRSMSVDDENQKMVSIVDFEVDPDRVTNSKQLLHNQANLIRLVRDVWKRIQATIASFPNELRITFAAIREAMMPRSTSDGFKSPRTEYGGLFEHVISSCVFLRFVCPAILSPSLFGLADNFADNTRAARTFTLVAKTILNLANFTLFGDVKELHMDFLNRFVAEEMPKMRALLWRLSEPPLCEESVSGVTESSGSMDTYSAKLVDVLTVLKQNSRDDIAAGKICATATRLCIDPIPVNSFCNRCTSIMLESEFQCPASHHDFIVASGPPISSNNTAANSHEELLRHQWMTELQDLQSEVSVCQQAIFGIPGQLMASGHCKELDQLNLAASLAHCHAQLEAAFAMVPQEKMDQPLRSLRSILTSLTHLTTLDVKDWHSQESSVESHQDSQQSICRELASSVSALSLARSSPHEERSIVSTRCKMDIPIMEEDGNSLKTRTPVLSAKAKSTQLVESKGGVYNRRVHTKEQRELSKRLGSTFNTTSEPGLLYNSESVPKTIEKDSPYTPATDSHLTTTNDSSWSLLHATAPAPSPLTSSHPNSNTTPTFFSDSSSTSINIPSPESSTNSSAGGGGRPSHHPVMGTSLYTSSQSGQSASSIHRSCTFPNSSGPVVPRTTIPPAYNPIFGNITGRTHVSVETQTSQEQVTELDEFVHNVERRNFRRNSQRQRQRHLYINILDDFEPGNLKLSS